MSRLFRQIFGLLSKFSKNVGFTLTFKLVLFRKRSVVTWHWWNDIIMANPFYLFECVQRCCTFWWKVWVCVCLCLFRYAWLVFSSVDRPTFSYVRLTPDNEIQMFFVWWLQTTIFDSLTQCPINCPSSFSSWEASIQVVLKTEKAR